jgi:succinyl-diaminopimelate desuccinylase
VDGRNAIHRWDLLAVLAQGYDERQPVIGCEFREACRPWRIEGAWPATWCPTGRPPSTTASRPIAAIAEAEAHVREFIGAFLGPDDTVERTDAAGAAWPATDHPLVERLVQRNGLEVRAKLGWTDVARFAAAGVPAANFGPGDPTIAHAPDERVERADLERAYAALFDLLTTA